MEQKVRPAFRLDVASLALALAWYVRPALALA